MADDITQTPTDVPVVPAEVEETPTWLQRRVNNHPRAAKVTAVIGGSIAALGVVQFARTLHANKDHLDSAVDHAGQALNEVAASTSPTDAEA